MLGGIDNALFLSSFGGFAAVGILIFFLKNSFVVINVRRTII
jgi:hypothetical protein